MPERRFWFFRTTIQAFCLVIEKGAVDYCVLSISLKPGSKNTASATMIMPIPQMTNHFSTPSRSARGPEMTRPNGMAREAALVSREKTLPQIFWFDRFLKNRILHTVKWSGNSHNSTAHNKDKKCVWRQKPGEHIANAHQENGKTDGVPPFLKTAPNAQNDSAKQHTNRKSNFSGRGMGRCSFEV